MVLIEDSPFLSVLASMGLVRTCLGAVTSYFLNNVTAFLRTFLINPEQSSTMVVCLRGRGIYIYVCVYIMSPLRRASWQ